jgi:hypothetical protein
VPPPSPRLFLCVSIDCECDKGPAWRTRRPLQFSGIHDGVGHRLQPLFADFGAKPTYLLSPELLRDERCVEFLASLRDCELGTHLHGELAEPASFEPAITAVVQRDYPPPLERAKLEWLSIAFRSAFGRNAESFRAGRFGIGPATLGILEDLGYTVDSSVTPFVDWSHVSPGLGFRSAPVQPYRPDSAEPAREGNSSVLEVPVTIRPHPLARVPFLGKRLEARWLRPTRNEAHELVAIACDAIEDARRDGRRTVVLNAMFHNVEVVAGASPYATTEAAARLILARLADLLRFARGERVSFVALSDVPEIVAGDPG